jgi:hypothetical protein
MQTSASMMQIFASVMRTFVYLMQDFVPLMQTSASLMQIRREFFASFFQITNNLPKTTKFNLKTSPTSINLHSNHHQFILMTSKYQPSQEENF